MRFPFSTLETTYHLSAHLDSYRQGYGQALSDFAVADLLLGLNRTPAALNPQEAETLAGLFVRQMADRIDEASIVAHLGALRRGSDPLSIPLSWEYPASTRIGANFPRTVSPPQFELGSF